MVSHWRKKKKKNLLLEVNPRKILSNCLMADSTKLLTFISVLVNVIGREISVTASTQFVIFILKINK